MNSRISGETYAALVTPRAPDGSLDIIGLTAIVRFLVSRGICSFAINGATGEFCLTTAIELQRIIQCVRDAATEPATLLCGVGAPSFAQAKELTAVASAEAVDGLLVPAPIFFRYGQDDLDAFVRALAGETEVPMLLYNLPQFSTGFHKETVANLIRDVPNVVGIKDSSGSLEIFRYLTDEGLPCRRLIGNDSVIGQALAEGLCDGVISGIACAVPEVVHGLLTAFQAQDRMEIQRREAALRKILDAIDQLPAPWGIKWLLEARGIARPVFAQPLSAARQRQGEELRAWFTSWLQTSQEI
jgi:4-hydroxy-tetrahydrodipicolinate synthase